MTIHLPYQLATESDFAQEVVATDIFTWVAARSQQYATESLLS
ncbi:hypothetical protein TFLX_05057 [Thermoflexales bacterium]|nr:hypothetical protein TFLX_05057 [Thermoflexales bacterium]